MVSTNNSRERGPLPRRFLGRLRRLPAPVWTLATIFGVAGVMCLFAAAFPISKTAPRELATIVGACLIVASLILLRFGARLPEVGLQGLAIGGTLVNALLVSQATTSYGATLNSMAWIWVAIYAGQFFDQRAVRIQVAVIGVASAAALAICGLPGLVTAWVLVAGSCILAGETLARLNTRLRTQLVTDPLTGLLNRAGFGEAAERLLALAAREHLPVSVALIDLDGFKQVNDLQRARRRRRAAGRARPRLGAGAARLRGPGAPRRRRVRAPLRRRRRRRRRRAGPAARSRAGRLERRRGRVAARRVARTGDGARRRGSLPRQARGA